MIKIPAQYTNLVGKKFILSGGIFSRKKSIQPQEFEVLGIRISASFIQNLKTKKRYPAFELLVKNDTLKKALWTNPFPIKESEME